MGKSRFVPRTTEEIQLSDGDWIRVKTKLTYGEEQSLSASSFKSARVNSDGQPEIGIDYGRYNLRRMEVWLTDWNFTDEKGKNVRLTPAAIAALDSASASEILTALDVHIAKLTGSQILTDEEALERLGEDGTSTSNLNSELSTIGTT